MISENPCQTSKIPPEVISVFHSVGLIYIYTSIKTFWHCSRPLMSSTSSVELFSVIFLASSSMVDVTSMCICPCGSNSTTSQSTSLLYHSTSGGVISSSPAKQSSQIFYNVATNANYRTSASASLSSSVCYCPCSTATSTSYMSCKYACREKQFIAKISCRIETIYFMHRFAIYA